jgi:hypothetical protein
VAVGAIERPQFCPWCGTPLPFEEHGHEPRHETLANEARARGDEPSPLPDRVEDMLAGESYVGGCPGCQMVSHVIGHQAQ